MSNKTRFELLISLFIFILQREIDLIIYISLYLYFYLLFNFILKREIDLIIYLFIYPIRSRAYAPFIQNTYYHLNFKSLLKIRFELLFLLFIFILKREIDFINYIVYHLSLHLSLHLSPIRHGAYAPFIYPFNLKSVTNPDLSLYFSLYFHFIERN